MLTLIAFWAVAQTQVPQSPVLLKAGDIVSVFVATTEGTTPYNGEYTITSDGSIYGVGFGELKLAGKTWLQAQDLLRKKMKPFRREQDVFLAVRKERTEFAYVIGSNAPGPVALPSSVVTVRQLLPPIGEAQDGKRLIVELVRGGKTLVRSEYSKLLQNNEAAGNIRVEPNDLISIVPQPTLRIWVLGPVRNPGQQSLPLGTNLYQAVASAGGFAAFEGDTTVTLRRGPELLRFPGRVDPEAQGPELTDGDVITIVIPETVKITLAGEVERPGEYALPDTTTVLSAVSTTSGKLGTSNLNDVLVYRKGELLQLDLSAREGNNAGLTERIQAGDTIIVQERKKTFYVFGEVRTPGKFMMEENKKYFASDALATAGGLSEKGTLRYVYHMRPTTNGKPVVRMFNLDEFLKDGKLESNPELLPGDSLLFGQPRGLSLSAISQILSSYVIVNSLTGPRK